ncbi:metal-sensitive transcriptional regulator [Leucobacter triazinivorans]|uniref:metal-sensitive transcriptional regulator n=1 Tax=Leucobacter triazinivorans TaxID=1784719 RepID=UPI001F0FFDD2|nr:metal-sensitive transcriptional regulator [Leucobacter triazinivorans]
MSEATGAGGEQHAHGYIGHKDELLKRLRRAEGQVRGVHRMVENDEYCIDILTQVSAATKALERVALALLDDHLRHCVASAAADGGEVAAEKLHEASAAIARLVR